MTRHATLKRQSNIERLQALAGDALQVTYSRQHNRNGFVIWAGTRDIFGPVRYEVAAALLLGFRYRGLLLDEAAARPAADEIG